MTNKFQEQRAERDARRDYEYDAKKRLYAECEPVLFEAMELAETFRRRVLSLARTAAREGLSSDAAPQRYRRQGLYLGVLDQIADALTVRSGDSYHCKSLGEFWADFDNAETPLGKRRADITALLAGFHPVRAPVLWRVLVSQYLLFGALLRTRDGQLERRYDPAHLLSTPDDALSQGLDWRKDGDGTDLDDVRTPLVVGYAHVRRRLAYLADHSRL